MLYASLPITLYFYIKVWAGRLGGSISILVFVGGAEEKRERGGTIF